MNFIDIGILVVLGICVVIGLYRGFVQSVLNLGGGVVSFIASFKLYPKLAEVLSSNTEITRFISTYTDTSSLLGDLGLSNLNVDMLSTENITQVLEKINLPEPLGTLLKHNLTSQVFSPLGDLATNVSDYLNQTVLSVCINVLSFIVCFLGCLLLSTLVINLLRAVFRFPILRHLDALVGGGFGLLLGIMLCYILLTVLPLLESVIPIEGFATMVEESSLAQALQSHNLIISLMNRKL